MISSWPALFLDFGLLFLQHFTLSWFNAKYIRTQKVRLFCFLYAFLYTGGYALFEYFLIPYQGFKALVLPLIAIVLSVLFRERSRIKSILYPLIVHMLMIGADYLLVLFFFAVMPNHIDELMSVTVLSSAPFGSLAFSLVLLLRMTGVASVFTCSTVTYFIMRGNALDSDDKRLNRFFPVFIFEIVFAGFLTFFTARAAINNASSVWLLAAFLLMFFIFDIILWNILRSVENAEQLRREKEEIATYARSSAIAYEHVNEGNARFRMLRHDMLNQLQTASLLLEQGKTEAVAEQLQSYSDSIRASGNSVTGNSLADALLSIKELTCTTAGIQLEVSGKLPENTPLNNAELCSVISNMLDNAIHGTTELQAPEKKCIRFTVGLRDNKMLIFCKNPTNRTLNGPSAKPSTDSEHGWGLHILKHTAEKYSGAFTITEDNGIVTALFWIPFDMEKEA